MDAAFRAEELVRAEKRREDEEREARRRAREDQQHQSAEAVPAVPDVPPLGLEEDLLPPITTPPGQPEM